MTSNEYKPKNGEWDFEGTHNEDAEGWDIPIEKKPVIQDDVSVEEQKEEPAEIAAEVREPISEPEPVPEPIKEQEPAPEPVAEEPVVAEGSEPEFESVYEPEPVPEPTPAPVAEPEPVAVAEEPVRYEPEPEPIQEPADISEPTPAPVAAQPVAETITPVVATGSDTVQEKSEAEDDVGIEEVFEKENDQEDVPEIHESGPAVHVTIPDPVRNADGRRVYRRPSQMSQIFTIYMLQMKLYSKNKITYLMFLLVALMPAIVYSGYAESVIEIIAQAFMGASIVSMSPAYLLIMLPLFMVAIPAMLCGRSLSSEFKNRTVYFNFPLPMSRTTFYVGKFLAGMTLCVVIMVASLLLAVYLGTESNSDVANAMVLCLSGMIAMAATAYGLGPLFKRGSTAFTIVLMVILPLILPLTFMILGNNGSMDPVLAQDLMKYVTILPIYAPFQTFWLLDKNFGGDMKDLLDLLAGSDFDPFVYVIVAALWSLAFIVLGLSRVKAKEL